MKRTSKQPAGTERARDEQRSTKTPRYGGTTWQVADERGDKRFGHARNDDADPSELKPGAADSAADESLGSTEPDLAATGDAGEVVSGGEISGMRRGEKPRKAKTREKSNPRATKKTAHPRRR